MSHPISTEEKLQERIKELSCLYNVSSVLAKHKENTTETLNKIAYILKKAWRFSEAATVEILIHGTSYNT
ncbi:hypothetical protein LZ575_10900 [Antarcticibacterium sp. 1MA-6-2]|uniref:hypothetical protein n=1 Tax=Antarcticibacterium sp. 1MA-6-2 TaxID=2908210 RepID=UPI001F462204|nr:hypothetical protein [Antarcticibacterium sp. 1MA-6-2]UJH92871.1 hypothetical protein LZ575_10900 [Antarcticibacterium sp. 1MA-6-2]